MKPLVHAGGQHANPMLKGLNNVLEAQKEAVKISE